MRNEKLLYMIYESFLPFSRYHCFFFHDSTNLDQYRSRKSAIVKQLLNTTLSLFDLDSTPALETILLWSEIYFVYQIILQGLVFKQNWAVSRIANITTYAQGNQISFIKSKLSHFGALQNFSKQSICIKYSGSFYLL